jgi:hypothetical protein
MLVLNKWVARETLLAGGEQGSNKKRTVEPHAVVVLIKTGR